MGDPHALARYGPIWPDLLLAPSSSPSRREKGPAGGRGTTEAAQEWPRVAKLLIQSHLVSFSLIPIVCAGRGARFLSARDDVCEQCSNQRGYGVMGSCRWFEGWSPHTRTDGGTTPPPDHPHPSLLPSREKGSEPSRERRPSDAVTTYATNVRAGAAAAQWAVVVGWGERRSGHLIVKIW